MDWTDIMPAIPLARAVPLINLDDGDRLVATDSTLSEEPWPGWRVDLEDPQGFSYALRWLARSWHTDLFDDYLEAHHEERGYLDGNIFVLAILIGDCGTSPDDRLALAGACRHAARLSES